MNIKSTEFQIPLPITDRQELRKARSVTFLKNGDLNHAPKVIQLTPHRYIGFQELQNDLTKKLNLPHGCRKIYTPRRGRQVNAIEDLEDQGVYICAGFEKFKKVDYAKLIRSKTEKLDRSRARVHVPSTNLSLPNASNNSSPERHHRQVYGAKSNNHHTIHDNSSPIRPKNILVILSGRKPYQKVNMIVNKRTVMSMDQLIADISKALGRPKWRNDRIQKLYTIRGDEIVNPAQIFSECDVFVAVPVNGRISGSEMSSIIEELYPESPFQRKIMKEHQEAKVARQFLARNLNTLPPVEKRRKKKYENETRLPPGGNNLSQPYEKKNPAQHRISPFPQKELSSSSETKSKIPRKVKGQPTNQTSNYKPVNSERNGRTYTMLEQNERELKQQLYERDQRLRDTERRQEELMARLREQEETSKNLKRQIRLQQEVQQVQSVQRKAEDEEARIKALENEYNQKEKEMENEMRRYREQMEAEQKRIADIEKRKVDEERQKIERERKRIEQEKHDLAEQEIEQKRREAQSEIEREWMRIEEEKARLKEDQKKREKPPIAPKSREVSKRVSDAKPKVKNPVLFSDDEDDARAVNEVIGQGKREDDADQWRKELRLKKEPRNIRQKSDIELRYEIGKKIGDGNFAIVYRCRMANTQSEFAMKVIDKTIMKGKEEMIENEIAIMRLCRHPNIVKLVEEFETIESIYLILELVRGGDLFDAITESLRYDESTAASLIADLAAPIEYLHARNIVHRDVKPENCLLERFPNGKLQIKLADFGLAMEVTKPIFQVCGTPTYVAPEILVEGGGQGYGLEVDNWAIGVITYILLCGFPPFRSQNRDQNELFDIIVRGEFEFLPPYWDNISDSAMDLIRKLLVVNPKKRLTAEQTLKHPWIRSQGSVKGPNLQRQVTLELTRHKLISQNKQKRGSVQAS